MSVRRGVVWKEFQNGPRTRRHNIEERSGHCFLGLFPTMMIKELAGVGFRAGGSLNASGVAVNSSIVLISAVLASLAVGVLVAYGSCITMFRLFRIHARQVAAERQARAGVVASSVVES